jgi:hypothetical protein
MDIETMDIEDVKAELTGRDIKIHHKTSAIKLREALQADVDKNDAEVPVEVKSSPAKTVKAKKEPEMTLEEKCLHLKRIIVTPNDPELSGHAGLVFTVMISAVNNGKAIKKYVPFNNEEGWHVPNVIINQIADAEMQKFKSVKAPNGDTILQPYQAKKFNVQVLPDLSQNEINKLAASQSARGDA